ncbi:TPA: lipase family protein [Klebsiella pneumoniae]|uniref:lipase family protein n=1 Tax=Klebsiella pneumoniae TaxID=573 RepID=UPI0003DE4222|nr:lipase family protein [Klebsiella pneumoniae]MBR8619698.1 lipase family protein [Klebsiella pneumoniae subsp. pneumoniae]MBZ1557281.1 lipase family protein [Klebsiella pneumoniae]MBZ6599082.1 lipase family protein [Klebsiella pneumoniae]MCD9704606.1 lipase family protein [Klebsiella pneumoniae]MCM5900429.1 lipase family protein [Klebsiella pneumoniae]
MIYNKQAANYAKLVIYSWDMCNPDLHCLSPTPDPRLSTAGWSVIGYITGGNSIFVSLDSGLNNLLRASRVKEDQVCYGYVAKNDDEEVVIAIRGTDGILEWLDDMDFLLKTPSPPINGMVDAGFYDIYQSLRYHKIGSVDVSYPIIEGIANISCSSITVLGHSLGAALGTYLIAELVTRIGSKSASACLFASPKPGDCNFADYFSGQVLRYQDYIYINDIVPTLPPIGYSSLHNYTLLTKPVDGITISSSKVCCHHLISYIALLDPVCYKEFLSSPFLTGNDKACSECVVGIY